MIDLIRARLLFVLWLSFVLSQCLLGVGVVLLLPDTSRGWDLALLDDFSFLFASSLAVTALAMGVSMSRWKFRSEQSRAAVQWVCIDTCGVIGTFIAVVRHDSFLALPFILFSLFALLKQRPTFATYLPEKSA